MESKERPIIISSTRAQKKYILKSKATNLAELKEECRAAGIDYEGLTFVEAITNTEMRGDNSLLPKEVVYKGKTTDNIVFSLTNPRKNIGSGMDRKEVYSLIKEYNLGEACKEMFGENYTRVSTTNLECLINTNLKKLSKKETEVMEDNVQCATTQTTNIKGALKSLEALIQEQLMIVKQLLEDENILSEEDIDDILENM